MTLAEKILAAHSGKGKVSPGEFINVRVDLVLANDITAPLAIKEFQRLGINRVYDPKKIVMVPDHFCPNKDILSAEQAKIMREFARQYDLVYFEVGRMGIEHVLLPSKAWSCPEKWWLELTLIPAPTELWVPLPPAWGQLILLWLWLPARYG